MKQIIQSFKTGDTELVELPSPTVKPGQILIKTTRSLVSLGTERMLVEFGKASLIQKARQQPDKVKMVLNKIKTENYEKYKVNFGRVDIKIYSLDWLYLIHSGHRRAKFIYDKEISMVWIAP